MIKIIKNLTLAAVLFAAAAALYAASSYEHCRCNQATPGLGTLQTSTCCNDAANNAFQNSNKDLCCQTVKGTTYAWTGGSVNWSSAYCSAAKTPCPAKCLAGYIRTAGVNYTEDGACCTCQGGTVPSGGWAGICCSDPISVRQPGTGYTTTYCQWWGAPTNNCGAKNSITGNIELCIGVSSQ